MSDPLRIGVAGLGTVGAALLSILDRDRAMLERRCGRPIEVAGVCARDRSRDRGTDLSGMEWFDDPVSLASSDIDVFVELIGGDDGPAKNAVEAALRAGHHVVTANKALLAAHGVALAAAAEDGGVLLNFEAAVAGGIPIIKVMREAMTANDIHRVFGILNGTCNYILTRMETDGLSFEDCLADAQALGYAEADPTFDIEGNDTAHKLAILAAMAFGTEIAPDAIYLEGITRITSEDIAAARDLGYRIKLLGVASRTSAGVETRVHPAMVPLGSPIAEVGGVLNAVAIEASPVGSLMLSGPGAGGDATASAVAGDLCDIAKARPGRQHGPALGQPADTLVPHDRAPMRAHAGGYVVRLDVLDRPGVMASVATRMAEQNISLESIVQRRTKPRSKVDDPARDVQPIVLVTHETTEQAIRDATEAMGRDDYLDADPQVIRIEQL